MDNGIFDLIFTVLGSVVSVMQRVTFLGIPVFYWSIGFLLMGAFMARLINTLGSPYMESASQSKNAALAKARHAEIVARQSALMKVYRSIAARRFGSRFDYYM